MTVHQRTCVPSVGESAPALIRPLFRGAIKINAVNYMNREVEAICARALLVDAAHGARVENC